MGGIMGADRYGIALICRNGHVCSCDLDHMDAAIKHCPECGEETISACPSCGAQIRGSGYYEGIIYVPSYHRPAYCINCGKPYPWTERALEQARKIADEAKLSKLEKSALMDAMRQIACDGEDTASAVDVVRACASKAGGVLEKVLINVATNVATQVAMKMLTAGV